MVSYLFYYQLALLASIGLFVMLHLIWPKRGVPSTTASVMPVVKPQRQGIKEPKPFDSPTKSPFVPCVNTTLHILNPLLMYRPIRCPRPTNAPVQLPPRSTFVLITAWSLVPHWPVSRS